MGILAAAGTVFLLWLALPGGGEYPLLLAVACVPLFIAIALGTRRQAMGFGLLAGVSHFLVQLYWIVFVLGQYGGLPLYLSVPALFLLSLYMACYLMVFSWLANFSLKNCSATLCLWLLPCIWVGLDWLRSFFGSGFPWMDLGYGFASMPLWLQSADVYGHYGLTFLVILVNTLLLLCFVNRKQKQLCLRLVIPVVALLLLVSVYSTLRWQQMLAGEGERETLIIGVVQSNVDQGQKWNPERQQQTVQDYIGQSSQLMDKVVRPELVVWPETALPFFPVQHPLLPVIENFIRSEKIMLLTGAPWYERTGEGIDDIAFFNSSHLFDVTGKVIAQTAKTHLVPFGEYVPMQDLLPFIAPLVEAVGDFTPGKIQSPPACQKANIGVLICFESIFPDISRKWVQAGANLLVNITNDAWYGYSSAPYQTLAMTRLRAVETRRSVVRSANTGFSAFIDPLGRLLEVSPLFAAWESTAEVQLVEEKSLFVRGGYLFAPFCFFFSLFVFVSVLYGRKNTNYKKR